MQWYEIISASKNKLSKLRTQQKLFKAARWDVDTGHRPGCRLLMQQRLHNWMATQHTYPITRAAMGISTPTQYSWLTSSFCLILKDALS